MTHSRIPSSSPVQTGATVLLGYLGNVNDDTITIVPSLDRAYSIEIRRCDVLAFDTVPFSGACRVVTSAHAVVEERWTVTVVHRRAMTAHQLASSAPPRLMEASGSHSEWSPAGSVSH